jgi:hypothetical protein
MMKWERWIPAFAGATARRAFCAAVDFNLDFFLFRKYTRPTRPDIPAGIPILSQ